MPGFSPDPELRSIYYIRKSAEAVLRERKQDPVWIAGVKFAWHPHRNVPVVLAPRMMIVFVMRSLAGGQVARLACQRVNKSRSTPSTLKLKP